MADIVLPNMGLIQSQISGDANVWGANLNANEATTDAHNHTSGRGLQVPSAGININADLSFGSQWAPVDLHRITFDSVTALIDGGQNQSLFVNASDHELYWRTTLGNNVKLTAVNSLNVAAFVGGIVGDYTAVGAAEAFDDANKAYTFKDGAGHRARVDAGGVKLIGFGTSDTIGVTLQSPPGITFSYGVTYPLALPGSTTLVQIDSTGQMVFSNALAVNQSITVSGTGSYKHGTKTLPVSPLTFIGLGVPTPPIVGYSTGAVFSGALSTVGARIALASGKQINTIRLYVADSATGPTKVTVFLVSTALATPLQTTVATSSASAGTGAQQTITFSGLTSNVVSGTAFDILVKITTGSAAVTISGADVDFIE